MQTIKLAIAEDHIKYRKALKTLLNAEKNLEVILEANNGEELLHQLENNAVDIIILDYRMPIMDGLEALKQIRITYPKIKTIINTTFSEDMILKEFKENGANSYLHKEADFEILLKTIAEVQEKGYSF